jgi:hypothetical protein
LTTIISSPQPSSGSSTSTTTPPLSSAAILSWIMDSFVFDEYNKKVSQVSQFVMENKFLEAIRKLVEYGNREFLRSFQLRSEIKERSGNGSNANSRNGNDKNNIIITDIASLIPPFETIGFLEAKWVEVLKELVQYGNKNILGNFNR